MTIKAGKRVCGCAASLILAFAVSRNASAADTNLFEGQTITYIAASAPGGGYDTYARLIARHMESHLPGTRFVVRNLPGAGSIIGVNRIFVARPDGLTIGTFNSGLIYNQLMGTEGIRFDFTQMSWIGKASNQLRVVVVGTNTGIDSFDEMLRTTRPVKFASAGVGSAGYVDSRILDAIFPQFDIQTIPGFDGAEGELSMIRGELDAQVVIASVVEQFVGLGHGYYALALSPLAREILPDVPLATDYVSDPQSLRLLALVEGLSDLGRLTVGPPGIPEAELGALRETYDKALGDPALIAEAMQINIPINPGTGEYVEARMREVLTQSPDTIDLLKSAATSR